MQIQPYLFFEGRAEEALEFYRAKVGAELIMKMRYSDGPQDSPNPMLPPGSADKIMHMAFTIGGNTLLGSDGFCSGATKFDGFGLALSVKTDDEAQRIFTGLGDGGSVTQPLSKTFFSSSFGMVKDRFGVHWMVMTSQDAT